VDVLEFKKDFLENVKTEAAVLGEGSCAAFVESMAGYLIDAEVLSDFNSSFYRGTTSKRKKYGVDGYSLDEADYTMHLVIADYDGVEKRSFGKKEVYDRFNKLTLFIDQAINGNLYKEIEMSTSCADLVDLLRENKEQIRKYRLLFFTDAEMSGSIKTIETFNIGGIPAECQVWDIGRLFRVCSSDLGRQNINIDFTNYRCKGLPCIQATSTLTSDYASYLCIIPGGVLADIYEDYGSQLLERNVRSFLSTKVAVNKEIRKTILTNPSMFFAFNNGIAATAVNVKIENKETGRYLVGVQDFQIINGGQTTASLSNARFKDKADLSGILIQMKLTEIDERDPDRSTELIRNISKSSNSQNKVSDADFFATHPFHIRMEQFSRRLFAPAVAGVQFETKWFYERARGQYLQAQMRLTPAKKKQFQLQNPKNKVITKTDLAKVRNTWDGYPQIVSRGAQTNFNKFAELIDEAWKKNEMSFNELYYRESVALMILFRHLEALIPQQPWYEQGYRANIVTYSIALLRRLIKSQFKDMDLDLINLWNRQDVPNIVSKVLEEISEEVFKKITDPARPTINVTQWCKRDGCWQNVQSITIRLPNALKSGLVEKSEKKSIEKEAKNDQKIISGVEAQEHILEYTADQWQVLFDFAEKKLVLIPDERNALKTACQIPRKLPNPYQSELLLALIDKALSEGFEMSRPRKEEKVKCIG